MLTVVGRYNHDGVGIPANGTRSSQWPLEATNATSQSASESGQAATGDNPHDAS